MRSSSEDAAVSELARRILRSSGVEISHNGFLLRDIEVLSNELSDNIKDNIAKVEIAKTPITKIVIAISPRLFFIIIFS